MKHIIKGTKEVLLRAIDESVVGFKSERNREILKDHYVYGMTFEETAEKHKMSVCQVKHIAYKYEPVIKAYISKLA